MYFGDTIHGELEIVEAKKIGRIGGGAIDIKVNIINQNDDVIMRGLLVLLIASRTT
jgi:acyl dehydratase